LRKIFSFQIGDSLLTFTIGDKSLCLDLALAGTQVLEVLKALQRKVEAKHPGLQEVKIHANGKVGQILGIYTPAKQVEMIAELVQVYEAIRRIDSSPNPQAMDSLMIENDLWVSRQLQRLGLHRTDVQHLFSAQVTILDDVSE
jgi:hypothetical protein